MATLKDKHLVVIGGSSGIGFSVAQKASMQGAEIILIGRNSDRLGEAKKNSCKIRAPAYVLRWP